jgi:hypothetical protein
MNANLLIKHNWGLAWKSAAVIMVLKSGDPTLVENY